MRKHPSKHTLRDAGQHLLQNFTQAGQRANIARHISEHTDEEEARSLVRTVIVSDLRGYEMILLAAGAEIYRNETQKFAVDISEDNRVTYTRACLAYILEAVAHLRTEADLNAFVDKAVAATGSNTDDTRS